MSCVCVCVCACLHRSNARMHVSSKMIETQKRFRLVEITVEPPADFLMYIRYGNVLNRMQSQGLSEAALREVEAGDPTIYIHHSCPADRIALTLFVDEDQYRPSCHV
jgi:hypothetical protein